MCLFFFKLSSMITLIKHQIMESETASHEISNSFMKNIWYYIANKRI
jgi:hypothetical protein